MFVGLWATISAAAEERLPDIAGAANVAVPGVGVTLGGYFLRPVTTRRELPALLLLHDNERSAEDLLDTARALTEQGYAVLALSMRGFRGSEGADDCGTGQTQDAVEALNWLARQPGIDESRLGILGFGRGGQVALLAAANTTLLRAVVVYFPVTDIQSLKATSAGMRKYLTAICNPSAASVLSPVAHAASISAPVLLIHGGMDELVPRGQSDLMQGALQAAGRQAELQVVPLPR